MFLPMNHRLRMRLSERRPKHCALARIAGYRRFGGDLTGSIQNGPKGPPCTVCCGECLCPGLTQFVDSHRRPRRRGHLHAMRLATEIVGDVPVIGIGLVGHGVAALDIPGLQRLLATAATDLGAHCGPGDSSAGCGDVLAPSAADLVAQDAADDGAGNRTGDVDAASFLRDLFAFDPAVLLGRAEHRAHRGDVCVIQSLVVATVEVVVCNRRRRIAMVVDARVDVHRPYR